MARGQELLSKDKGESFDEICTSGTVYLVFGSYILWHVLSIIGGTCTLKTGLVFNADEQQRVVQLLQPEALFCQL